ncbi:hypothetical protein ACFWGI_06800 [Streptomyces niveus]|uniref:hypothetical protein n=1 Tax=Streptomyces niveus TaxID=193462 RepID=UPI00366507BD
MVIVVDTVDEEALRTLRRIQRTTSCRTVLVTTGNDEPQLVSAAECGVAGLVRGSEATPERLVHVIGTVARGDGYVPADPLLSADPEFHERLWRFRTNHPGEHQC